MDSRTYCALCAKGPKQSAGREQPILGDGDALVLGATEQTQVHLP